MFETEEPLKETNITTEEGDVNITVEDGDNEQDQSKPDEAEGDA